MKHGTSADYSYMRGGEAPRKRVMGRKSSNELTDENGVTFQVNTFQWHIILLWSFFRSYKGEKNLSNSREIHTM
jgi:hypothetical protein